MLNYKPTLLSELKTLGLPVRYELFNKTEELPCITYQEANNFAEQEGDTFGYSTVEYRIKV